MAEHIQTTTNLVDREVGRAQGSGGLRFREARTSREGHISAVVESKKGTSATVKSHEGTNANVESKKKKIVEVMDLEEKAIPKGMIRRYYLRRLSKRPCRWRLSILGKRLQR